MEFAGDYTDKCTGCRACNSVCPHNAISMVKNSEGFLYPEIDGSKCTECGLCRKVCSIENSIEPQVIKDCYAVTALDEIRLASSSGGVFTILAEEILNQGGYVCGAAFNKNWEVEHIIINNIEDLERLQRSKYVQSDIKNCLKDIKKFLQDGKQVLFCGCPCQVEGLKLFLQKDYENLLTLDLICHNVPSPKVFDKFLSETYGKENIVDVNFREKTNGWTVSASASVVTTKDGYSDRNDIYFKGFLSGLYSRKSCYHCKYTTMNRTGDLTLADFWGIDKKLNDEKGISQVLVNSLKGEKFLIQSANKFKIFKKCDEKEFLSSHNAKLGMLCLPQEPNPYREDFFKNIDTKPLAELTEKFTLQKPDICILSIWKQTNYGALLVGYAMQELIKSLGYTAKLIDFEATLLYGVKRKDFINVQNFADKYLDLTKKYYSLKQLYELNNESNIFITGSDQIWKVGYDGCFESCGQNNGLFLLSFINNDKKKIAYAVSFGERTIPDDFEYQNMMSCFIQQLDDVSLREKSGVDICKKYFNKETSWQLDPVLLGGRKILDRLADNAQEKLPEEKYIAAYILDESDNKKDIISYVENKLGLKSFSTGNEDNFKTPESFVNIIKNSEFLVTDSFHGTVLAIIYNKPYIAIRNIGRGQERFVSLAQLLNLQKRLVNNVLDVRKIDNLFDINWESVNNILEEKRELSLKWLKDAIEKPKSQVKNIEADILNLVWYKQMKDNACLQRIIMLLNSHKKLKCSFYWHKLMSRLTYGKRRRYHVNNIMYYRELLNEIKAYKKSRLRRLKTF